MKLYTNHGQVSSAQGVPTETVKVYKLLLTQTTKHITCPDRQEG